MKTRALVAMAGAFVAGQLLFAQSSTPPRQASNSAPATSPAASKDQDAVRKAETDRFAAMLKADVAALDKLLAEDLTYTHGDGRVIGKAAFLSDFRTGAFKYTTIEPTDVSVRVFGDVAVVTGGAAMHVVNNGAPADIRIRYTDVHVRRNGAWQMVAWEATRLPNP
jgi:ketosteroid isomerase-like protein